MTFGARIFCCVMFHVCTENIFIKFIASFTTPSNRSMIKTESYLSCAFSVKVNVCLMTKWNRYLRIICCKTILTIYIFNKIRIMTSSHTITIHYYYVLPNQFRFHLLAIYRTDEFHKKAQNKPPTMDGRCQSKTKFRLVISEF